MSQTIIKDDLFRAVLAMDVYHRGYNSGLNLGETGQIGHATIGESSKERSNIDDVDHKTIGFFAQAYTLGDGTKVIAYRGTDSGLTDISADGDVVNGYGIAIGKPDGPQGRAAIEF